MFARKLKDLGACRLNRLERLFGAFCALASMAQAAPALADYSDSVWIGCTTQSKGIEFRDAAYGITDARARVLRACQGNAYTNNGECRYNVSCEREIPGAYARCTTESRGIRFLDGNADINLARDGAINQCTANAYTNNGDCRYNIRCEGGFAPQPVPAPYPPYNPPHPVPHPVPVPPAPYPPIGDTAPRVCTTTSNGRTFTVPGRGLQLTRGKVIGLCRRSPYTDSAACEYNARCN